MILKIGSFFDKFFGYSTAIIKWFIFLILFLDPKQRKKITPVGLGLFDFFLNNLGKFDRDKGRFN